MQVEADREAAVVAALERVLAADVFAVARDIEAAAVDQRFAKAWTGADVKLTASRF